MTVKGVGKTIIKNVCTKSLEKLCKKPVKKHY